MISFQFLSAQTRAEIDSLNNILPQNREISTDSLLVIYQSNLANAEKINYDKGIADSYWQLSIINVYQGNYEESLDLMLKAIRIYERGNHLEKLSDSYGELGYKMKRDDMQKAQYYMNKGMKIAEDNNYRTVLGRTYNNYGVLKEMQEQFDSAKFFYKRGLKIVLEDDYKTGIPYSYSNLAGVYGLTGMADSARYYFNKAKDLRREIGDNKGIAENYTQIGEVYMQEGKPVPAISNFKKSLPLARQEDYRFLIQYTYKQISDAFKMQRQTDSALFYLEKHNAFKDSIQNLTVQERIAELNLEFETEKKENEILQQKNQLAENNLKLERRNFTISGILVLLILGGLLAYLIINRQKIEKKQLAKEKELEIALAKLETQDKLEKQRLMISRDLHDNIGSQLTFITSSLENLKFHCRDMENDISGRIEKIRLFTAITINELRDTIWAMNKENISYEELKQRIQHLVASARSANEHMDITTDFESFENDNEFSAVDGINIYRIIQESLNNALKYSEASSIYIKATANGKVNVFKVQDNGKGYDESSVVFGNGIHNMKKRAKELDARLILRSEINSGTEVVLEK